MSGLEERREEADEGDGLAVSGEVDGPQPALVLLLERLPAAAAAALTPLPLRRLTRPVRPCACACAPALLPTPLAPAALDWLARSAFV